VTLIGQKGLLPQQGVFMDGIKMKKFIAVVLVAAMAIGSIFASPLNLAGSIGSAKIYDETFSSVSNANQVKDNWIIRTSDSEVAFENDNLKLNIGESSLVQIMSVEDDSSVVYLLDGWLSATTSENVNLTINTTVTEYQVAAGSTVVVISNATTENGYVHEGSVKVNNTLTTVSTEVTEGNYLDLSQSASQPQKPEEGSELSKMIAKLPAKAQVETQPETQTEATAQAEAQVEVTEEVKPLTKTFTYAGYQATITAYVGQAIVEYPTFVTEQEIYDAAAAAYSVYSKYLDGVYIQVIEDGKAVITYPETYGQAEFEIAISLLEKELPYYIASLFNQEEPLELVEVEVVEVNSEPAKAEEETVLAPLTKTFTYADYQATITAYVGQAIVEYPTFVTEQEIYDAAAAAYSAYSEYLDGVYIQVVEDGKAVITYPEIYGQAEFEVAISLLEKELPYYIASLFETETPESETEVEVWVDTTEAVVIEIVAPETPAKPTEEQPEKEEVAPQPVVEQPVEEKKKTNVKFGANVSVVYGKYTEGSEYKPFIDKNVIRRVVFAPKNTIVSLDPYLTIGNFTIGLHASIDVSDVKGSFKFTTDKGIIGYISSVASYIGSINYNGKNVKIAIDRNHSVEFSSPVFYSLDKAFDENNSLVATGSVKLGFLTVNAFVDDLQLTDHLSGKNQFAGLSLSAGSKHVTVNLSAIANVHSLTNIDIYPAIDAVAKIEGSKLNVEIYGGVGSLYNVNNSSNINLIAKAKVTLDTKHFNFGVGAAYNRGQHINDVVNNAPATVVKAFNGVSIDVLLSSGLKLGVFSLDTSMSLPLSLNGDSHLVYNTVKTRSGSQIDITADVFSLTAKLDFNWLSFSGGILFEGFTGRLETLAKAFINKTNKGSAVAGLLDSNIATMFAQMTLTFGNFEAYARGDLATIKGTKSVSTSFGASYKF
jgi:hypothetical protein